MSASAKKPIENAVDVIDAFGGLRPMSAKINVAVTTIQGWKKRNVIPGTRRKIILDAATEHGIDLSEILSDAPKAESVESAKPPEDKIPDTVELEKEQEVDTGTSVNDDIIEIASIAPVKPSENAAQKMPEALKESAFKKVDDITPQKVQTGQGASANDDEFTEFVLSTEKRAVTKSASIAALLVTVVVVAVVMLLWPDFEEFDDRGTRLSTMEQDISSIKTQQSMFKGLVPENWNEQLENLKAQAQVAKQQVDDAVDAVQGATDSLMSGDLSGALIGDELQTRVVNLQSYVSEVTGNEAIYSLMGRFESMRESNSGQDTLDSVVSQISAMVAPSSGAAASGSQDGQESDQNFNAMLNTARNKSAALGKTFEGVPQNELKAAAMLLALTQVRSALNRKDEAFDGDLDLLMGMVGAEDTQMKEALTKIAPYAKSGVLSAGGLKSEFQTVAGDAVAASLRGEDVSFGEQLSAKMNDILKIEKDGELVSGTETQVKIDKAEKMVMEDRFGEAVSYLKEQLNASELEPLRPWIDKAESILTSSQVQGVIEKAIAATSGEGLLGGSQLLTDGVKIEHNNYFVTD